MRALKIALATLALCLVGLARPNVAEGQRIVVLADSVRAQLARDWDRQAANPYQNERAYCVQYGSVLFVEEIAYYVTSAVPAKSYDATPNSITYLCKPGENVATLHIHTPASCDEAGQCVREGIYARQCFPSDVDARALVSRQEPFALIQCDRNAVVFYWPHGVIPPAKR